MASPPAPAAVAGQPSPRSGRHHNNQPPPPPTSASAASPPWSHVVRGDPEGLIPSAELPPPDEAIIADADQSALSDGYEDGASAAAAAAGTYGKRFAWRSPTVGAVEAGPVVMGAASWPALSESAKALPKSSQAPFAAASDAQKPPADATSLALPAAVAAPASKGSNSTPSHTAPVRQKSFKRGGGGGGGGSTGIGGSPTNGGAAQKSQPPEASSGVAPEKQVAFPDVSPRDRAGKGNSNWDHGSRGGGGDHQRGYRRGNNGGGGSHQNNNYGNRRDHERGSFDGYNRGRDVHMQQRGARPYNRPPPPLAPPFMSLPPQARPFLNPVVYPDMPSPVVYIAPPSPESFRGFPFVHHPPAPPMTFFPAIDTQRSMLLNQIDYYFSQENLCKDLFLRKNMDEQGWVPLSLVAGFNRVKTLTDNMNYILDTVRFSTVVELQGEKIRKRNDWMKWILPPNSNQFGSVSAPHSPTYLNSDTLSDRFQVMGLGDSANLISMPVHLGRSGSGNLVKQLQGGGDLNRQLNGKIAGHTDSDQTKGN